MEHTQTESPGTGSINLEICCPVETRVLALLRSVATTLAEQIGFGEEEIGQIEMAVDEACANVVRHAYKHRGVSSDLAGEDAAPALADEECVLKVRITIGRGMLRFSIIDHGIGMDKTPSGAQTVEEYVERGGKGGLGSLIIRNFMDEVDYEFPEPAGTILTMTKYLRTERN
ncbi:ATP-binding protein [Candidatus Poribacteria bacterium]|nr:ATP-binding protein [Candidatus Poribacteria bacterium]